eukprot:TRINITY_DN318_c2_g1_i1.p1 TRINITY_DN318_c2_g1~~TRINITY_DN318_c2_g1_i1.p1  ORF type:complete len:777 (+),score=119.56 TRINITY_DN318_c2_g1_i1:180-2510(+)
MEVSGRAQCINRQSTINNQQSTINNQQSTINNQQSSSSLSSSSSNNDRYNRVLKDLVIFSNKTYSSSPYASIVISNVDKKNSLINVKLSSSNSEFSIQQSFYPRLEPGQTLPIDFTFKLIPFSPSDTTTTATTTTTTDYCNPQLKYNVNLTITAMSQGDDDNDDGDDNNNNNKMVMVSNSINILFTCKTWPIVEDGYVFTFPDVDNSIQYAVLRAPIYPCTNISNGSIDAVNMKRDPSISQNTCPIIFTFHGAGVASGPVWANSYLKQNNSWILLPTNRRPFGFDWQGPGRANAWSSFHYFVNNLPGVPEELKRYFTPDPYRIIYAGHSMGGHGCWLISSHYPDRALAIAPASGWINMEFYQPYFLRIGKSLSNPKVESILEASIYDNHPDFYLPQLKGIPAIVRYGSLDDNVPPFHMRRMARLLDQLNGNSNFVEVSEVPGEGHWFDGVVDGPPMQDFFNRHSNKIYLPALPLQFTVLTVNPASSEGRGGLRILQLQKPTIAAGYVQVSRNFTGDQYVWLLQIENVARFQFQSLFPTHQTPSPTQFVINNKYYPVLSSPSYHYYLPPGISTWEIVEGDNWMDNQKHPLNYGPTFQVWEAPIVLVYGTAGDENETKLTRSYARNIANIMWYRGRFNIQIYSDINLPNNIKFQNIITIGDPTLNYFTRSIANNLPVKFYGKFPSINGQIFSSKSTGITFLSPGLSRNNVIVVLAGTDNKGLKKAFDLLPIASAITMPDYAIAGPDWGWAGSSGLLAVGFWDNNWNYSDDLGYIKLIN